MKRHPRAALVAKAGSQMTFAVSKVAEDNDLTAIELSKILTEQVSCILKHMLRAERHPEDPDSPADVE